MTQDPVNNSGNDFIRGLATNPCINGITKTDALEIKKIPTLESETNDIINNTIPSLDDRITALENSSSSSGEWIKYTNENTITDIIDLTTYKSIKDIKICFNSSTFGGYWTTQIEKNTSFNYLKTFNLDFYCFPNDNSSHGSYFFTGVQFDDSVYENLSFFNINSYPLKAYHLVIDSTTINQVSWTSFFYYYDEPEEEDYITIYYKN